MVSSYYSKCNQMSKYLKMDLHRVRALRSGRLKVTRVPDRSWSPDGKQVIDIGVKMDTEATPLSPHARHRLCWSK